MPEYKITCKQIVCIPSDADDKHDLNLSLNEEHYLFLTADNETQALDKYHKEFPIGCLEDYEITAVSRNIKSLLTMTRDTAPLYIEAIQGSLEAYIRDHLLGVL
jgi:hypothetical protein